MSKLLSLALVIALTIGLAGPAHAATPSTSITNPSRWITAFLAALEGEAPETVGIKLQSSTESKPATDFFGVIGEYIGVGRGAFTLDARITSGPDANVACRTVCFEHSLTKAQYLFLTDKTTAPLAIATSRSATVYVDAGPTVRSLALDVVSAGLGVIASYVIGRLGLTGSQCKQGLKELTLNVAYESVFRVITAAEFLVAGRVGEAVSQLLSLVPALLESLKRSIGQNFSICASSVFVDKAKLSAALLKSAVAALASPFFFIDVGASITSLALSAAAAISNLNQTERVSISVSGATGIATSETASKGLSAGGYHTCVRPASEPAYCWGFNDGRLGDGTNSGVTPTRVFGAPQFSAISAGLYHTCALDERGAAYCWGQNLNGALGDGTAVDRNVPTLVASNLRFSTISAGYQFTCAISVVGATYCWGTNEYGQLGNGTSKKSKLPVLVAGGHRFVDISVGRFHTCAITAVGSAYCWGSNFYGALGDSTLKTRKTPSLVFGGLRFTNIESGWVSTCALTAAAAAFCWGANTVYQLGDGTTKRRKTPVQVLGGLRFVKISVGAGHACALTAVGAAYCWGINQAGRGGLGTGFAPQGDPDYFSPVPRAVIGGYEYSDLDAGGFHTCATTKNGRHYCWGFQNEDGRLGDGTQTWSDTPVLVAQP